MHPEILLLIVISFSFGFTPGPNNAVASYSGFNFGIKKTIPLIMGTGLGYTILVLIINYPSQDIQFGSIALAAMSPLRTDSVLI